MIKLRLILTFTFLLTCIYIYGQNTQKITDVLFENINNMGLENSYTIWIFFKDKGVIKNNQYNDVKTTLNKHSLERRQKLLKNKPLVDFYDFPLKQSYINEINPFLVKIRQQSKWLNAISAEVKAEQLENIAALSFVKSIDIVRKGKYNTHVLPNTENEKHTNSKNTKYFLNYGPSVTQYEQINVPAIHEMGYTGKGVIICVLDAGFNNLEHRVFEFMHIIDTYDFVNDDNNVDDEGDLGSGRHGTLTLSTIGGFFEGELIGPAYGASYLLAKTENTDSETQVEEDNWVAAVEWAEALGADITSTSLGYSDFDDGTVYSAAELDGNTTVITIASDIAAGKGMLVVNSAGNNGDGITTINAPADGDSVLTVGAVDSVDTRASFSSVGPTGDGRIKPDVMAMGKDVYVADVTENNFKYSSGTSFSCPITAGAAALLWEMFPFADNMKLINALKQTANNANNPNNQYGWGIIDLYAAYEFLAPDYTYSVNFKVTADDIPVNNAEISLKFNKQSTDLYGTTVFENVLASNNIECIISKPGYSTFFDTLSLINTNLNLEIALEKSSVTVYPQPAAHTIFFDATESLSEDNFEIAFYDLNGKIVKEIADYRNKSHVNISNFLNGVYIAQIKINGSVYEKKIIVSK